MAKSKKDLLEQIVIKELSHCWLPENIGLYSGKMGFSIFLYHYFLFTDKKIFADFAEEIIGEVCESLDKRMPLSFDNGLSGIGWGLEYLAKKHFIEIDDNSVFEELNYKILEINPENVRDCSFHTGLEGISTYVHAHASAGRSGKIYFPKTFIQSLEKRCAFKTDDMVWDEIAKRENSNKRTWQNGLRILLEQRM